MMSKIAYSFFHNKSVTTTVSSRSSTRVCVSTECAEQDVDPIKEIPFGVAPLLTEYMPEELWVAPGMEPHDVTRRFRYKLLSLVSQYAGTSLCDLDRPLDKHIELLIRCAVTDGSPNKRTMRHSIEHGITIAVIAMELVERFFYSLELTGNAECRKLPFLLRLLTSAFLLAVKQVDDFMPWVQRWAESAGVLLSEIIDMEAAICDAVDWRIHVTNSSFNKQVRSLKAFKKDIFMGKVI
jgi:hypothetical protein